VTKDNNDGSEIGDLERLRSGHVYQSADLHWVWGTSLRRRTSLDLMACKARGARRMMMTASGHAYLEGAYR
jgi:hypothetical protein